MGQVEVEIERFFDPAVEGHNNWVACYDPWQIVEKTKERTAEDDMWLKFKYCPMEGTAYGQKQS